MVVSLIRTNRSTLSEFCNFLFYIGRTVFLRLGDGRRLDILPRIICPSGFLSPLIHNITISRTKDYLHLHLDSNIGSKGFNERS